MRRAYGWYLVELEKFLVPGTVVKLAEWNLSKVIAIELIRYGILYGGPYLYKHTVVVVREKKLVLYNPKYCSNKAWLEVLSFLLYQPNSSECLVIPSFSHVF